MADTTARRLPRGRHRLSREQVETDQRLRIAAGLVEAMGGDGYVGTSVADIIGRAGVSRETFYRLYDDKQDCFLSTFDLVAAILVERVEQTPVEGSRMERVESVLTAYLQVLANEPAAARLFLVEVHAAGDEAIARRAAVQERLVDVVVARLEPVEVERVRAAARIVVAAVASLVVPALVADDLDGLRAIGPMVLDHVAELDRAGVFGAGGGSDPAG